VYGKGRFARTGSDCSQQFAVLGKEVDVVEYQDVIMSSMLLFY
jgi:hypothetical protein